MTELDPDTDLMRRVADGDSTAVGWLVASSTPRIFAFCARILGDRMEAEDVAQETLMRAFRHAGRWQSGRARLDTWLHSIALNLCRDRLRRTREYVTDKVPDHPDTSPDPEASLLDTERQQAIAKAIGELPDRQREAVLLVHYQELSGAEAASALGVTLEALESLLSRGRRRLREQLSTLDRADDQAS